MKLLLLSGSFHSESKSLAILNAIRDYFPEYEFILPQLNDLPFYCEDLNKNKPDVILELLREVAESDGIVVCTPEYNHSVPAVLKNAIDWVSRPAFNSVLKEKPISLITQANSPVGGARAQAHLKLIFDSTLSVIYPCHEMMITDIGNVINSDCKIVEPKVESRLKRHISNFCGFISGSNP